MSNDNKHHEKEIDALSGVETTGHEWDGLKELNNPLPRWWLWVFIICILWSVWYFVVYPAWPVPGGHTKGTAGYTEYDELKKNQAEIIARQQGYLEKFETATYQKIMEDPALYGFAQAGGAAAFKSNCATCHGSGAQGGKGYPNLNDDDWLWGGKLEDIQTTIEHGIRYTADEDTRVSQMPAFGKDGLLKKDEIEAVVDYVLTLSGADHKDTYAQGADIFKNNCAACHGEDGKGSHAVGAANLTDKIWLYGGDRKTVYETVYNARAGVMPAWSKRLDENTIRELTVYLHELGGGEAEDAPAMEPVSETVVEPDAATETQGETPATQNKEAEQPATKE